MKKSTNMNTEAITRVWTHRVFPVAVIFLAILLFLIFGIMEPARAGDNPYQPCPDEWKKWRLLEESYPDRDWLSPACPECPWEVKLATKIDSVRFMNDGWEWLDVIVVEKQVINKTYVDGRYISRRYDPGVYVFLRKRECKGDNYEID